jgi:hypothetical protein
VFRATVTADENTNVDTAVGDLRARCESGGVAPPAIEMVTAQLREILTPLVANGKILAAQGSQLKVTRDIGADGCDIKLVFCSGIPRAGWRKVLDRLLGS